jgi:signal transduction histidine kinase
MGLPTLKDVFNDHKDEILEEVVNHISTLTWSHYQQFLVHTDEGRGRLKTFVDLFGRALQGDRESFFKDQERVGYARALMEGFEPEALTQFYTQIPEIMWNTLKKNLEASNVEPPGLCDDLQDLNSIFFQAYGIIMGSYLKVRGERIHEKVGQLQDLQRFAQEVITLLEPSQLSAYILCRMTALFGADAGTFCLYREGIVQAVYAHPPDGQDPTVLGVMHRAYETKTVLFTGDGGEVFEDLDRTPFKRVVSAPVQAHGRVYGVLCLRNRSQGFRFTRNELEFLNQFLYIMALALGNAFMLEEVEQARAALSQLTGKMITIQEEERRRLAADIHDTLTQVLIGISYKIQLCKELTNRSPEMIPDQLDTLLEKIDQAIDQSRNLISSLRPDLIDTMGLVPALQRHVESFSRETGIQVRTRFPDDLALSSEVNICLFRVAQEALMNVYKHAETKEAEVDLRAVNGNILFTVSDRGKGFLLASDIPLAKEKSRLGLLSLKERIESIGGSVRIEAGIRRGCSIHVTIPHGREEGPDGQDPGDDCR